MEVSSSVKRLGVEASKIPDSWQGEVDKAIHETIYFVFFVYNDFNTDGVA